DVRELIGSTPSIHVQVISQDFEGILKDAHKIVNNALAAGAHAVTAGADVFESAFAMPSIQKAVDDFSDDWFVTQNSRSI
ncbi:beta/alpha barrel domain-containing protein, partial [Streptococcus pneumoniae]